MSTHVIHESRVLTVMTRLWQWGIASWIFLIHLYVTPIVCGFSSMTSYKFEPEPPQRHYRRLHFKLPLILMFCFFVLNEHQVVKWGGGGVAYHCELLRKDYSDDEDDDDEDDQRLGLDLRVRLNAWNLHDERSPGMMQPNGVASVLVCAGWTCHERCWLILFSTGLTHRLIPLLRNLGGGLSQEKSWRQRPTRITTRSKRSPGDG